MSTGPRQQNTAHQLPPWIRTTARVLGAVGAAGTVSALAGLPYGVWILPIGLGLAVLAGVLELASVSDVNSASLSAWFHKLEPPAVMRFIQGFGVLLGVIGLAYGVLADNATLTVAVLSGLAALVAGVLTTEMVYHTGFKTSRVDAGRRQAIVRLTGDALDDDSVSEITEFVMHVLRHNKAPRWLAVHGSSTSGAAAATVAPSAAEPTPATDQPALQEPEQLQPTEQSPEAGSEPAVAGQSEVEPSEQPTHEGNGSLFPCEECMTPVMERFPTERPGYGVQQLCLECASKYEVTFIPGARETAANRRPRSSGSSREPVGS